MKLVVELGMGDGRHLYDLSKDNKSTDTLFIGIEKNSTLYLEARRRINADNVLLINDSFEKRIREFQDGTIDKVVMILPDPEYVDRQYYDGWTPLYTSILLKLKDLGKFELVTEIIDDLLEPVADATFYTWVKWISEIFVSLGFGIEEILTEAPPNYASTCLDKFRQDPERIRLLTLRLFKPLAELT